MISESVDPQKERPVMGRNDNWGAIPTTQRDIASAGSFFVCMDVRFWPLCANHAPPDTDDIEVQ
jgi:hypothetical protein